MQFHFGQLDDCIGFSDPNSADILEAALKTTDKKIEFHRYPNAKHAFMNSVKYHLACY